MLRRAVARESLSQVLAPGSHLPSGQFGHGGRRKLSPSQEPGAAGEPRSPSPRLSTDASWLFASSPPFCRRALTRERSSVSVERGRGRSRSLRGPGGRKETGPQEAVLKQLGHPFAGFALRFACGQRFARLCVDHKDLEVVFQPGGKGVPKHPGAFHGEAGTILLCEPVPSAQAIRGQRLMVCRSVRSGPFSGKRRQATPQRW